MFFCGITFFREAIKDGDEGAIEDILKLEPSLASFVDHNGYNMLHLVCQFYLNDVVFRLVCLNTTK